MVAKNDKMCYTTCMHITQKLLVDLIATHDNLGSLSLRKIAELVGAKDKPQTVKYHLQQLEKAGFIQMNLDEGVLKLVKEGFNVATKSPLYSLPIYGAANCGPATIFAEQRVEGYLKISSGLLPRNKKGLFVLKASGSSMNKAEVEKGKVIEDGDYLLIDSEYKNFKNGDIVVAVVDGMANIKKYRVDKAHKRIVLESESTGKYHPIFIHEEDDLLLNGKVVGIIKS
jgi:SOS-response transcriptional repressor LexA